MDYRERDPRHGADPPALALPLNPLGVKGVGEGGPIAPPAVIANAVADPLSPYGAEFNMTPVRPEQIVRAVWGKTGAG